MRIKSLEVLTHDLEGTGRFYHDVLGLQVLEEEQGTITIHLPSSILRFHQSAQPALYHIAFNIPHNMINDACNWLHDVELIPVDENQVIADFRNWNAKSVYFLDNNKNILEFIARRDLANESSPPFSPKHILSVSEIGIVGDKVSDTCTYFKKTYGLPFFSKQPALPNFAAMGDDEGLLIVVPENRNWYPTEIQSGKYWMRFLFENEGRDHVFENKAEH